MYQFCFVLAICECKWSTYIETVKPRRLTLQLVQTLLDGLDTTKVCYLERPNLFLLKQLCDELTVLDAILSVLLRARKECRVPGLILAKNGVREGALGLYVLSGQLSEVKEQADEVPAFLAKSLLSELGRAVF